MLANRSHGSIVVALCAILVAVIFDGVLGKDTKKTKSSKTPEARPNIVFIYTDDQDDILGSLNAMPNLQQYVMEKGVRFTNSYVSTPLCCPSRSALATGRYAHNTGAVNNMEHCGSDEFNEKEIPKTWIRLLQASGYRTFFAGKYIHRVPHQSVVKLLANSSKVVSNITTIPPGWDWFNRWKQGMGFKYYYNYTFYVNQTEQDYGSKSHDYLTTVVQNFALDFIRFSTVDNKPFFMMVAPTSPHGPPLYESKFSKTFSNVKALRTSSFGHYSPDKHFLMRSLEMKLNKITKASLDQFYRDRWRSLISVDRMIVRILNQLAQSGKQNNTIIVFSSDNGFHMGQFNLPVGKRKAYEFDLKVPLIFMGPGIAKNKTRPDLVQNIDLGPTFLELAGVQDPRGTWHDGKSMASLLRPDESDYEKASKKWRNFLLVEYTGECNQMRIQERNARRECNDHPGSYNPKCVCSDAVNNTYSCVRHFDGQTMNEIYCEYEDVEQFREYYDLTKDPWQLQNIFNDVDEGKKTYLKKQLLSLKSCRGSFCWLSKQKHTS